MRKKYIHLSGLFFVITIFSFLVSCDPGTTDCACGFIGDWPVAPVFDGEARSEAVCFTIGDYAYICTGNSGTQEFKDLWQYDTTRKYWTQKADLPGAARNSAVGFSIGTKGYLGTGYDGTNKLNDFWEYDQASNTWAQKDNFPGTARYDAVAFSLNNKGYISCGYDGDYRNDLWQFDPSASPGSQWIQKASINGPGRSAAQLFVLNKKAYVCSGDNNGTALNDLWMYNDSTDTWTEKRKIANVSTDAYDDSYTSIARWNGVVIIENNLAYLTTGKNHSLITTTWEYDPSTDLWTQKKAFTGSVREGAVGFSIDNKAFIATGRNGTIPFDDCYEWKPNDG